MIDEEQDYISWEKALAIQCVKPFLRGFQMLCLDFKPSRKKRELQPDPSPSSIDIYGDHFQIHRDIEQGVRDYQLELEGRRARANVLWTQYCKKRELAELKIEEALGFGQPAVCHHDKFGEGHIFVAVHDEYYKQIILYWSFRI